MGRIWLKKCFEETQQNVLFSAVSSQTTGFRAMRMEKNRV